MDTEEAKSVIGNVNKSAMALPLIRLLRWRHGKDSTCRAGDARDTSLIPGSGRSPGVENGSLLQYFSSILPENSMSEEPSGLQSDMTEQSTAAAIFKQEQSKNKNF